MIIAEVKSSSKCKGEYSVFLTFPYNVNIINILRDLTNRYWHPEEKIWELSIKSFKQFLEKLDVDDIKIIDNENILAKENETKIIDTIPEDYQFKTTPFEHQLVGIKYGLEHSNFLLNDEQGLGKTMQVINIACIKKELHNYQHCLIVCGVNGLKWNWKAEVEKHSKESAYILGTRIKKNKSSIGSVQDRLEDLKNIDYLPYFIITNIETLRNDEVIKELKLLCKENKLNIIAIDEIHKCKSPTSIQGKAILKLQADNMIAMTGTPLMNSPLDLYVPLKWIGEEEHNFYQFKNHYCVMGGYGGYEITGYKNLEQLSNELKSCSLRRLKNEVLDLPEKIYTTEFVEMTPKQNKIYKEVKMEIKENIDMIKSAVNPLTEMIRLRQATGYTGILSSTIQESAKLDRLEELVDEIVESGNKAIVFSNWTSMTNPIYQRLKRYNPAYITGETKNRVEEQDKFMLDDDCKIIIGTTGAMGTGLTLTAASYVIFFDEPWNRANREQAEDRAHRIGTKENVNIIFLICKDTIDERIHQIVEDKGAMADMLIDGKITKQDKEELVDFLLS